MLTLKPVHHAIQDAAGDDSPTGVGRGLGPTGDHFPGLTPVLKASSIQAAARLDVVVLVIHPAGHPVSFLRQSPRPCWGSRTAGPTSSQGRRPSLQPCLWWYHFVSPLILYSARSVISLSTPRRFGGLVLRELLRRKSDARHLVMT